MREEKEKALRLERELEGWKGLRMERSQRGQAGSEWGGSVRGGVGGLGSRRESGNAEGVRRMLSDSKGFL